MFFVGNPFKEKAPLPVGHNMVFVQALEGEYHRVRGWVFCKEFPMQQ